MLSGFKTSIFIMNVQMVIDISMHLSIASWKKKWKRGPITVCMINVSSKIKDINSIIPAFTI